MGVHLNLEIVLVCLTLFTGLVLLYYFFKPKKDDESGEVPLLLDYSKSFFPILLIVIVVRSFVAEPFRIPSGSMIPTLEIGDFILVKKYAYGIKLPIIHKKIISTGKPERGDVVVFRYPPDPKINYIKRLIGLPGDKVRWTADKKLILNDKPVNYENDGKYLTKDRLGRDIQVSQVKEFLPDSSSDNNSGNTNAENNTEHKLINFPGISQAGEWQVPEGHYFMMGDNRDNSSDSRFWKFVPEQNLVGKASFVWMHWDWSDGGDGFKASRIGTSVD